MAVSADSVGPVQVNGFPCTSCSDIDYAKKHIDPAHPQDGPYGVDDPSRVSDAKEIAEAAQKVEALGQSGSPAELAPGQTVNPAEKTLGSIIDLRA